MIKALLALGRRVRPNAAVIMEIMITFASYWVASILLTDQQYFDRHPDLFNVIMRSALSREWQWGLIAANAALTKTLGLAISMISRSPLDLNVAFMLRTLGWGLSSFLWGALAVAVLAADTISLGTGMALALCGMSIGALLAGPAMPDDAYGR